ncbi:hypothetical protein [Capnocytophaga catalasegens]|uniref:Lipoprotein n=1 Tax=Capnocytophaga catalasegens TaxID=1004260 RepID=A0AAV5AU80_9FLAO|nr:hypothetical protein [Capnocytophaga catalasegens]GJM50924.1 hypothetical protein RCZ15_18970 [Capnocytophaga catalasegens]GJM53768.1 hypothetical protein RCZ16_20840 [Capnocytophaga catalasegens]
MSTKSFYKILLLCVGISFISCRKDVDNGQQVEEHPLQKEAPQGWVYYDGDEV